MIARLKKKAVRRTAAAALVAMLALSVACTSYTEIPIETPIKPKLDVSAFQRIFIAGFIAGANEDVDANMETVRLLRSQLRNKGIMRVIDADTLPLLEVAKQLGFTEESFDKALADQELFEKMKTMQEQAANEFKLEGTPTFYINGKQLTGDKSLEELKAIIDPLLA